MATASEDLDYESQSPRSLTPCNTLDKLKQTSDEQQVGDSCKNDEQETTILVLRGIHSSSGSSCESNEHQECVSASHSENCHETTGESLKRSIRKSNRRPMEAEDISTTTSLIQRKAVNSQNSREISVKSSNHSMSSENSNKQLGMAELLQKANMNSFSSKSTQPLTSDYVEPEVSQVQNSPVSESPSSPPNFLKAPSSHTSKDGACSTGVFKGIPDNVKVKVEPQDDIKDYAETTMNELLGWYGLPKMDKGDTGQLALTSVPPDANRMTSGGSASSNHNSSQAEPSSPQTDTAKLANLTNSLQVNNSKRDHHKGNRPQKSHCVEDRLIRNLGGSENGSQSQTIGLNEDAKSSKTNSADILKLANDSNNNSSSCDADDLHDDDDDDVDDDDDDEFLGELGGDDLRDSVSVNSDVSGASMLSPVTTTAGVSEGDRGGPITCAWCQQPGSKLFTLTTPTGVKGFCSEMCFNQCRRASFKKNKVCDWCKHVRHTVNFVDFQDGDTQLQFCSEKCLNQYKMNIFCTEARQHLQHMQALGAEGGEEGEKEGKMRRKKGEILITPELWLKGGKEDGETEEGGVVKVKQEVNDEERDGELGGGEKDLMMNGRQTEEEEEPGEVREREKARRASQLEFNVRSALGDDSNSSCDRAVSSSSYPRQHRSPSQACSRTPTEKGQSSESRSRRERERIRKLLVGESIPSRGIVPGGSKEKSERQSSSPTRHSLLLSPRSNHATDQSAPGNDVLSNWATHQLLSMMPSHVSSLTSNANHSANAAAALTSTLGRLGFDPSTNPLLYSSLFGPSRLMMAAAAPHKDSHSTTPPSASSTSVTAGGVIDQQRAKSRHEARRELLRDRDRSRETDRDRKRDVSLSSSVPPVIAPSPSPSQSSGGTPSTTPSLPSNMIPPPNLPPGLVHPMLASVSDPNRPFPLNPYLASGDANPLAHYFMDPNAIAAATAGLLQFPYPFPTGPTQPGRFPPHPPPPLPQHPGPHQPSANTSNPNTSTSTASQNPQPPLHPLANPLTNLATGVPPVTVMVPYPFAVPIPVPIPIPLPIAPEKLAAYFKEKANTTTISSPTSKPIIPAQPDVARWPTDRADFRSRSSSEERSVTSSVGHLNPSPSPSPLTKASSCPPYATSVPQSFLESAEAAAASLLLSSGRDSTDSIMTLRREISRATGTLALPHQPHAPLHPHQRRDSVSPASSTGGMARSGSKRGPSSPANNYTLDLSKRARLDLASTSSAQSDNEAIDLSKLSSRSSSPGARKNSIVSHLVGKEEHGKVKHEGGETSEGSNASLPESLGVPRIHIVSEAAEAPPLSLPPTSPVTLPPPTEQSIYSSRRSRILDAPNVPKKSRSPSPERRYIRTVPRDMVEAARRRGLRARVRTK